jgi:AAA domain-containing protein
MNGSELVQDENKRVLLYSRSGGGKTSLVGKALEVDPMCPLYVFDFDLRINSILAVVDRQRIVQHLTYDQYRDGALPGSAFTKAETKLRELDAAVKAGTGPKTVALDSLTFMEKSVASRVLMMNGKPANSPLDLQHYKLIISQIEDFISKLCALNCNVIVTAHEGLDKDDITGAVSRGIRVVGKALPSVLPGYFNELWYAEVTAGTIKDPTPQYRIRTQPTAQVMARSIYTGRIDALETQDIWKKLASCDTVSRLAVP